jgi:hypothetical protein
MKKLILTLIFVLGCSDSNSDIDKIIKAKNIARSMANYPDTVVFHEMSTQVSGNSVTLKFTAKNAFGVPSTHTTTIQVK